MAQEMKDRLKKSFLHHLKCSLARRLDRASSHDRYMALALSVRDLMVEKWINTAEAYEDKAPRSMYYISLEYLIGRTMGNAMINLGIYDDAKEAMAELGFDLQEIREQEVDAGLGNGGLGRLAACYMDSLATLNMPALGYGIRYDYGIFEQKIENGYQVEEPDNWLRFGNPWEICRTDRSRIVHFHGRVKPCEHGRKDSREWVETQDVLAMPYDTPIPGYGTDTVNTLRLWSARSLYGFNLNSFNQGDYLNANLNESLTENITKVLYPNDNNYMGKELRLKQQYFMVSATMQDIVSRYKAHGGDVRKLHEKVCVQLNDTHPSLAIPELMRILVDIEHLPFDTAWDICTKTFNYTNHTLMGEALERWPVAMLEKLIPRIMEIIFDINVRLMRKVANKYPCNNEMLARLSLIEEGKEKMVRMAYMAVFASSKVNGVAELHTELLKNGLFHDFYQLTPSKFVNVTNGITPRRWICKANPGLSALVTERIGPAWIKNLDEFRRLSDFKDDKGFLEALAAVKRKNKVALAQHILEQNGVKVDPSALFDVQVKRLHEYKRQLLNILHAISLYLEIKDSPSKAVTPRVILFGAKAAPGYFMAKLIIKLINSVGEVVNNDDDVGDKLKILFLANYRVSLAEKIIPAADLSEQISLAGTEASGTGNMKFALNGALTIGTLDGANVEIRNAVGDDNIFIFGMTVEQVNSLWRAGYRPWDFVNNSPRLKRAIDLIRGGFFSQCEPDVFTPIVESFNRDTYMVAADFEDYAAKHRQVGELYQNPAEWTRKSLVNISQTSFFSSDRSIREYCEKIWNIRPFTA